jgi:hypothetical protein
LITEFWRRLKALLGSERSHVGVVPRSHWPQAWRLNEREAPDRSQPVELFPETHPFPPDALMSQPVSALIVAGIVNPFGPTLTSVVASAPVQERFDRPLVWVMLNPFQQQLAQVGWLASDLDSDLILAISSLFGLPFGGCPTLLLPNARLTTEEAIFVHAQFLAQFADAKRVLERVRAYPGNPWDRVQSELDDARVPNHPVSSDRMEPLTEPEALELATLALDDRHAGPELQAFFQAWQGAIAHSELPATMDYPSAITAIEHLTSSCRLPVLPGSDLH